MGMEPCDVGPVDDAGDGSIRETMDGRFWTKVDGSWEPVSDGLVRDADGFLHGYTDAALRKQRHHPNGIEPPELYEQWRAQERAKERDLTASCPDVKSYTQACRYMHAEPPSPQLEPYQAEGAVFARLIGNE